MKSEWFKRWDDEESVDDYWSKTRDEDDKDSDSDSTTSSWWDKFHGSSKKKSSYTPVKSTSAYLRSSYGTWYSSTNSRTSRDDLLEVLKEVNKTINLTQNSSDGLGETNLTVRYSAGYNTNSLLSDTLFISPDIMKDENGTIISKDSDEYYNGLDALNGQAMLCSFMRKSVSPTANYQYTSSENWAVRNIYMTDLQTTAGNEICSDWPGFTSYIEQQQRVFQVNKEEVLGSFQDPNQNIDNFINLLCYNRLSKDRINYRDHFDDNIAGRLESADYYFNQTLDTPWHNDGRFERANDVFSNIQRMLSLDEPPPPPPPNDPQNSDDDSSGDQGSGCGESDSASKDDQNRENDNDNQGGEGDSDNQGDGNNESSGSGTIKVDNIDKESKGGLDRRYTGDNSYNGQSVENQDNEGSDIDPNEKLKDRGKTENDSLKNIEDVQLNNVRYKKITPAVNDHERDCYKSFVAKSRRVISAIKDCFQFHNTDVGMYSYGLSAGGIDENSMHKVYMGEYERLYERRDVMSRKKWLVSILIDQSGSMCDPARDANGRYSTTRQDQANQLAIVFGEALKGLHDLDFSIYGFSTEGDRIDTYVYRDKEVNKLEALITAGSHSGTGIGFHVAHVGDKMISQYGEYENKILFVVTDGEPNCTPTPTMNGYEHTKHCCDLLRKSGIQVFGIGIANAFNSSNGDRLFGPGQHCVINDVAGTLNILVNRVRGFLQRRKK